MASPVPPAGGSQGTGQDLSVGDRIPVRLVSGVRSWSRPEPAEPTDPPGALRFTKTGKIRFTSHRDVARMWERALRRSRLPVAYSQGFSPHPLLSFGLALPTGCESCGEYLDLRLEEAGAGRDPRRRICPALLSAAAARRGSTVAGGRPHREAEGSLQQEVASCDWELEVLGVRGEELQERVEQMLAAPMLTVQRERKGRQTEDDIRPAILTHCPMDQDTRRSSSGGTGHAPAWRPPRRPCSGPRHRCGARTGL